MTTAYYQDDHVTLWHGDALDVLRPMESGSVDCIVTSPPYYGLRDYGVDGQLGAEASPAEYVENMRVLFAEARRVLSDDGTLWLNLGDSYAVNGALVNRNSPNANRNPKWADAKAVRDKISRRDGIPPKNLLGIPWRVAFALQDDGWILRNDIIWYKPNAMPESVTDRLSNRHEHLFLLTKSRRYWFNLDPIREEPTTAAPVTHWTERKHDQSFLPADKRQANGVKGRVSGVAGYAEGGRNPGDVWAINTAPFAEAHFAVMPPALAERCVQAGCRPGGTVLDPFSGSGTTGMAAAKHGRRYVGIDLNANYLDLSLRTRLQQPGLDLEGIA